MSAKPAPVVAEPVPGAARWNSRAAHSSSRADIRGSLPKKPRLLASAPDQITSSDTGRHSRTRSLSAGSTRRYPVR